MLIRMLRVLGRSLDQRGVGNSTNLRYLNCKKFELILYGPLGGFRGHGLERPDLLYEFPNLLHELVEIGRTQHSRRFWGRPPRVCPSRLPRMFNDVPPVRPPPGGGGAVHDRRGAGGGPMPKWK